jgi:hypothetical protein
MRPTLARPTLAAAALAVLFTLPAGAQSLRYPVKSIDFDIWCTEIEHLSEQRCDERRQADVDKFETYRHNFEKYEIPYLRNKENVLHFDDVILNNDPVDKRPDSTIAQPPSPVAGH